MTDLLICDNDDDNSSRVLTLHLDAFRVPLSSHLGGTVITLHPQERQAQELQSAQGLARARTKTLVCVLPAPAVPGATHQTTTLN